MPLLTIFTPSYNRAHTLPRLYESLRRQSNKDFLWLIIDDGSSDNTRELVDSWIQQEQEFEIRYVYKENGGMHTAHNTAYSMIDTVLNMCIDSDDKLAEDAVQVISDKWGEIRDNGRYAGMIGLDADFSGRVIGTGFPAGMKETTLTGYYEQGGKGDKKLVYRTDVVRQHPPYPVFEGEKYVALAYLYRLIDQKYQLAVLNNVLCNVEYQPDGSSMNMLKQYVRNPKGFAFWRTVTMKYPTTRRRLFIDCMHYVSSSIFAGNKHFLRESPKKGMTVLAIPGGILLNLYIRWKVRE